MCAIMVLISSLAATGQEKGWLFENEALRGAACLREHTSLAKTTKGYDAQSVIYGVKAQAPIMSSKSIAFLRVYISTRSPFSV